MNELAKKKFELLLKDLKDMQKLEKDTGKQYFTLQLFAIRVKEIYKLMKGDKKMNNIIGIIQTYKEDNPHVIITDDMIKQVIEENIDELVKEVKEEL